MPVSSRQAQARLFSTSPVRSSVARSRCTDAPRRLLPLRAGDPVCLQTGCGLGQESFFSSAPPGRDGHHKSCPISLRVFSPRIASNPTLALKSAPWTFRFFTSLIVCFLVASDDSLNRCLEFRVHYTLLVEKLFRFVGRLGGLDRGIVQGHRGLGYGVRWRIPYLEIPQSMAGIQYRPAKSSNV